MRVAILLLLTCGLLACVPGETGAWLSLDRQALLDGEIWRLWTGHLVHFSAIHAASDIMLLFIVAAIVEGEIGVQATGVAVLVSAPLISSLLMWLVPDLVVYEGSSALSAFLGLIAGTLVWRKAVHLRPALGCVGAVVIAKSCLDAMGVVSGFTSVPDGIRVAWQAHVIAWLLAAGLMMLKAQAISWMNHSKTHDRIRGRERKAGAELLAVDGDVAELKLPPACPSKCRFLNVCGRKSNGPKGDVTLSDSFRKMKVGREFV